MEARTDQHTARKAWSDYSVICYLNKLNLTCDRKLLPYIDINPSHILSYFIAELYPILTHCWGKSKTITLHRRTIPNLNTMLRYTLPCYNAELFPNMKHSSSIPCLITLLRCSQSWNIADVYLVFLDCWDFPNLKTLLT